MEAFKFLFALFAFVFGAVFESFAVVVYFKGRYNIKHPVIYP